MVILNDKEAEQYDEDHELVVPVSDEPLSPEKKQYLNTDRLAEILQRPDGRETFRLLIETVHTPYFTYLVTCAMTNTAPAAYSNQADDVSKIKKRVPRPMSEPLILTGSVRRALAAGIVEEQQKKQETKDLKQRHKEFKLRATDPLDKKITFTAWKAEFDREQPAEPANSDDSEGTVLTSACAHM